MTWLDRELADGRSHLAGDTLTMADIAAVTIVDFAELIGMRPIKDQANVAAWQARMAARRSFGA